jgi:hypothetical protein
MKGGSGWITSEFKLKGSLGSCRLIKKDLMMKTVETVDM